MKVQITGKNITITEAMRAQTEAKLSKMDKYERNLFVIFKLNKGILVESNLDQIEEGFVLTSFKELLKVQNSVSLPILYSKKESNARFVIKAGNSVYSYTIVK